MWSVSPWSSHRVSGDGVGPEMMDSCQEVLQSMGARLDFEPIYFSEVRIAAASKIAFIDKSEFQFPKKPPKPRSPLRSS